MMNILIAIIGILIGVLLNSIFICKIERKKYYRENIKDKLKQDLNYYKYKSIPRIIICAVVYWGLMSGEETIQIISVIICYIAAGSLLDVDLKAIYLKIRK